MAKHRGACHCGKVAYEVEAVVDHLFCPTCGVEAFARGKTPDGKEVVAVNVRCLEGVEVGSLTPTQFDGRSLR